MGKIKKLPENIINQIAAGEVIERPASVVKEFLENALDAGAKNLEITVQEGGLKLIKVSDDGQGLSSEDALLSIQKHATSKIFSLEDLSNIQSFGFRGEALASIASVCHFEMTSRETGTLSGFSVKVKGGGKIQTQEMGRPEGTTVIAANLFFNTPARLKFMKKKATEENHIISVVSNYALSYPGKTFKLVMGGKTVLSTTPVDLKDRIGQVLGKDIARSLVPVGFKSGNIQIHGAVSLPTITKPTREGMLFFVNHRWISNPSIGHAVMTAYHTLLPTKRFPIAVLFLEIPPDQVDVNVHPTKKEVKFARDREVYDAVVAGVRGGILSSSNPKTGFATIDIQKPIHYFSVDQGPAAVLEKSLLFKNENRAEQNNSQHGFLPAPLLGDSPEKTSTTPFFTKGEQTPRRIDPGIQLYNFTQLFNTFIIFQSDTEMFIADQHTVHERINYERLMNSLAQKRSEIQTLLVPLTLEFNPKEAAALKNNLEILAELGLEITPFGGNTFLFSSVPSDLKDKNLIPLLKDLADELTSQENTNINNTNRLAQVREKIATFLSCRSAVMAGDRLNDLQMKSLIDQMRKANLPFTCPHGRPTIISIPLSDLYRKFDRH